MSFVAVIVLHANAGGGLSTYGWAVVLAFVCLPLRIASGVVKAGEQ